MPKGKNMDCVHKCVYNRSLEFEKNKQQQTIKMKKTQNTQKKQKHHTHTHTRTLVKNTLLIIYLRCT